jgi:hypothetical protein
LHKNIQEFLRFDIFKNKLIKKGVLSSIYQFFEPVAIKSASTDTNIIFSSKLFLSFLFIYIEEHLEKVWGKFEEISRDRTIKQRLYISQKITLELFFLILFFVCSGLFWINIIYMGCFICNQTWVETHGPRHKFIFCLCKLKIVLFSKKRLRIDQTRAKSVSSY